MTSSEERKEERRVDGILIAEIIKDVKTLLAQQSEIKTQVLKTNGRVNVLEKFMWVCIGGGIVFGVMNLPQLIKLLNP